MLPTFAINPARIFSLSCKACSQRPYAALKPWIRLTVEESGGGGEIVGRAGEEGEEDARNAFGWEWALIRWRVWRGRRSERGRPSAAVEEMLRSAGGGLRARHIVGAVG